MAPKEYFISAGEIDLLKIEKFITKILFWLCLFYPTGLRNMKRCSGFYRVLG